jgi:hypothetical protein
MDVMFVTSATLQMMFLTSVGRTILTSMEPVTLILTLTVGVTTAYSFSKLLPLLFDRLVRTMIVNAQSSLAEVDTVHG